jgi:hypothetical protein
MKGNILIKEASVSTLSVEIKAIHINNRQLTLSIFKQIPEESILDANYEIKGVVWGRVNYFWKDAEQKRDSTIHIVWSNGSELRRSRVTKWPLEEFYGQTKFYHYSDNKKDIESYINILKEKSSTFVPHPISYLEEKHGVHYGYVYGDEEKLKRESVHKVFIESARLDLIEQEKKILLEKAIGEANYKKNSDAYQVFLNSPQLYIAA